MKALYIPAALMLLYAATGCNKTSNNKMIAVDSMAINVYGGYTERPQNDYFKITPCCSAEDTSEIVSIGVSPNYSIPVADASHQQAKNILSQVPNGIINNPDQTFQSRYADGGGITVTVYKTGKAYEWRIEDGLENAPDYVEEFQVRLKDVVMKLKQ